MSGRMSWAYHWAGDDVLRWAVARLFARGEAVWYVSDALAVSHGDARNLMAMLGADIEEARAEGTDEVPSPVRRQRWK